jgi:hypothetical protein
MTTLDLDGNGRADLVFEFPGAAIWVWMNNGNWLALDPLAAEDIAGGDSDGQRGRRVFAAECHPPAPAAWRSEPTAAIRCREPRVV